MDARPSYKTTSPSQGSMPQDSFQQQPSVPHQPSSQSSQSSTLAPSDTGHGASGQSVTTLTEHVEAKEYQAAFAHQHRRALTPDHHDFSHAGTWAASEPHADTFVIENDPILSPIHRVDTTVEPTRKGTETTDRNGRANTEEAVGILRASLHRKVQKDLNI